LDREVTRIRKLSDGRMVKVWFTMHQVEIMLEILDEAEMSKIPKSFGSQKYKSFRLSREAMQSALKAARSRKMRLR